MEKTLLETVLTESKPSAFAESETVDLMRPRTKYDIANRVKKEIDSLKGMASYQSKEDVSAKELEMQMEIWLHGLNHTTPPQFKNLK